MEAFKSDMGEGKDDRRQELVFIGQNIKKDDLIQALDACLLAPDETVRHLSRLSSMIEALKSPSTFATFLRIT